MKFFSSLSRLSYHSVIIPSIYFFHSLLFFAVSLPTRYACSQFILSSRLTFRFGVLIFGIHDQHLQTVFDIGETDTRVIIQRKDLRVRIHFL